MNLAAPVPAQSSVTGPSYGPATIETVKVEWYVVAYALLGTVSWRFPLPTVAGAKLYVPAPFPAAAEATVTALPLSSAVSAEMLIVGGAASPVHRPTQVTVGAGMDSELVGNVEPPDGQPTSVGLTHVKVDALKVTCQPVAVPRASIAWYVVSAASTFWLAPVSVATNEPGTAPVSERVPAVSTALIGPPLTAYAETVLASRSVSAPRTVKTDLIFVVFPSRAGVFVTPKGQATDS